MSFDTEKQENQEKQKILIVDDMPINIQVLAGAFKSDYQVKVDQRSEGSGSRFFGRSSRSHTAGYPDAGNGWI